MKYLKLLLGAILVIFASSSVFALILIYLVVLMNSGFNSIGIFLLGVGGTFFALQVFVMFCKGRVFKKYVIDFLNNKF